MNHTLEQAEKAVNWFKSKGINAETNNESVKIRVEGHWVFVSSSEIEWRAEMWDDEKKTKRQSKRSLCSSSNKRARTQKSNGRVGV